MLNPSEAQCRMIVGLGNPGSEYVGTRHNAGFEVIDRFLAKHAKNFSEGHARNAKMWEGSFAARGITLLKPGTFMNLSGEAVAPQMRGGKLTPSEILVVYDDMDIPVGRLRIRKNGGSAGHNGMKSIIEALGTEDFPRMRIGIGDRSSKRCPDFVLSGFEGEEKEVYERLLTKAAEALELLLRRGVTTAMETFNPVDCTNPEKIEKQ